MPATIEFVEGWQWFKASIAGVPSSDPVNGALVFGRWTDLINATATFFTDAYGKYCAIGENGYLFITLSHNGGWTVGFRFNLPQAGNLWTGYNNADALGNLTANADGTLTLRAGGSGFGNPLIGTSNFAVHFGKWYYAEISCALSGSAPVNSAMQLKINGELLLDGNAGSNFNAAGLTSGTATINRHSLTGACSYRDIVMRNQALTYGGDVKIIAVRPNGDVITQWTPTGGGPSYTQVNEDFSDFDATKLSDILDWQDIPGFAGTIQGIQASMNAKKDDEGLRTFKTVTGDTGSEEQSDEFFLSDDYVCYRTCQDVDPATGLPYTQAGFNAKRFGVRVIQ